MPRIWDYPAWPPSLEWIFDELKPTKLQRFTTFQPDAGPSIRRPKHSAVDGLEGTVEITEKQWKILPKAGLWSAPNPRTGKQMVIGLWDEPFVERSTTVDGVPTTRLVRLAIVVHK